MSAHEPVCAICSQGLIPVVEHLQCILACRHLVHELCLQKWLEHCPQGKKPTCPGCDQSSDSHRHPTPLDFPSTCIGGAHGLISSQKSSNEAGVEALAEVPAGSELNESSPGSSWMRGGRSGTSFLSRILRSERHHAWPLPACREPVVLDPPTRTTTDALAYLKTVRATFQNQLEKHDEFHEVMRDFRKRRIDKKTTIATVRELFKGDNKLISDFKAFTKGYKIKLHEQSSPPAADLPSFGDAASYLRAVKDTFQNERETYDEFLGDLSDWRHGRIDTTTLIMRVEDLFEGYDGLICGLNIFLPDGYELKLHGKWD